MERVIDIKDERIGLEGYLVIDSEVNGSTTGGIRMLPNITLGEIKDLARVMTLKQSFIGIPKGGARAGIKIDDNTSLQKKQQLLNRFGEKIADLIINKEYLPASDMGTTPEQILNMHKHIGSHTSKTSTVGRNPGHYTSLSVMVSIIKSLEALNLNFKNSTFAIEGFGRVGSSLASLLYNEGAKIVAISTINGAVYSKKGLIVPEILKFKDKFGDKWIKYYKEADLITKEQLLELDVDVLCPCGRSYQINNQNMAQIKARAICAGANNPITKEADKYLFSKGVLYLPDFMTNCGGVLGNAMEFMGLDEKTFRDFLFNLVGDKFMEVIKISRKIGQSPYTVGERIAIQRLERIKAKKDQKTSKNFVLKVGLRMYRKGLVPQWIIRRYALKYFNHMLNEHNDIYEKNFNS